MAKGGGMMHSIIIYLPHLLAFCGFAILLGGIAAVQQRCGSVPTPDMAEYASMGYLPGRVSCDKFFRYTWWITFFHFFVWFLVLAFLLTRSIHKFRAGLVGLLAAVTVLLMDTANTYLYFRMCLHLRETILWALVVLTSAAYLGLCAGLHAAGTFKDRTLVVFSGALISAVADGLLLMAIGWHDEMASWEERTGTKGYGYETTTTTTAPGTTPVATNVQSTTAAAAV